MFFRSRFVSKLYFSYIGVVLLTSFVIGILIHTKLQDTWTENNVNTLRSSIPFVELRSEEFFLSREGHRVQSQIESISPNTYVRVTLIYPDGTVLADSARDPSTMDNHLNRQEIDAALRNGSGIARRFSATLKKSMLYVASAVRKEGQLIGFVRLSIPLTIEQSQIGAMRYTLLIGTLVGIFTAIIAGAAIARKITRPINEVIRVTGLIREGQDEQKIRVQGADEISKLGQAINELSAELKDKLSHLSHEEAQLRAILTNMVEGVIAVDASDSILFCNRSAMKLLGSQIPILPGKKIWHFTKLRELRQLVEGVRKEGGSLRREICLKLENRDAVLDVRVIAFKGADTEGVIVVLHDVSDLRRLETVRRDFVANVSHELKTPLTSIKGYVETLLGGAIHDDQNNVNFLSKIGKNVDQLTNLVQDLLRLGQIESQEAVLPRENLEWRPVLKEAVNQQEIVVARKGIKVVEDFPSEPLMVRGDSESMLQIADNLISNAVKYTPEGGEIRLKLFEEERWVCLRVVDTGIGIPKSELPRIFERFYRVDKARSRALGGTGLGLAIVKHLASALKGQVTVTSEVGRGCCFTVYLPKVA